MMSPETAPLMMNDLRYTVRMLRKSPLFTLAVVGTVALAIGANTAIFSVVNAVMLRPLPYEKPDRLIWIAEKNDKLNLPTFAASVLNYLSWKEQSRTFEPMGAFGFATFNLTGLGDPEQLTGGTVTPSLFPLLGIKPLLGRAFAADEDRPGSAKVAMIGEGLWKRRFGGDPSVVGRHLTLNSIDHTVIGIAPASLALLSNGDLWTPMTIDPATIRLNHVILAVGRLRPGRRSAGLCGNGRCRGTGEPAVSGNEGVGHPVGGLLLFLRQPAVADRAPRAALRGRLRAADRGGECREPAAGAGGLAAEGNRHPHGHRREPRTAVASAARREPGVVVDRWGGGIARGALGCGCDQRGDAGKPAAGARCRHRLDGAAVRGGADGRDRSVVRHRAGVPCGEDRPERGSETGDASSGKTRRTASPPRSSRSRRFC